MSETRSVSIGGSDYHVRPFKTYKAVLVGLIVASAIKEVRQIAREASRFRAEFREENKLRIDRQDIADWDSAADTAARLKEAAPEEAPEVEEGEPRPKTKAELELEERLFRGRADAWRDQLGGRDYIEMPQEAEFEQVALAVFPKAFEMHEQLAELLALLVMADSDLLEGWRQDSVHQFLQDRGAKLLEESEPQEILDLAKVANDVIGDQLRPLIAAARELWDSLPGTSPETIEGTATEETTEEEEISGTRSTPAAPTSPGPSEGSETPSSSSSESPTDPASLTPTG